MTTQVNHPRFGKGTVTECTGSTKLDKVTVSFDNGTIQSFIIKQSNLTTLDGKPFMAIKIDIAPKGEIVITEADKAFFETKYGNNVHTMNAAIRKDIMAK
jgi:zona occludens toxin (predicted ATPase)